MIDEAFLRLVRCPVSGMPLDIAPGNLIHHLNGAIGRNEVMNRLGEKVREPIDGGLITRDRSLLYPVRHEIPTLIGDEAFDLRNLGDLPTEDTTRSPDGDGN